MLCILRDKMRGVSLPRQNAPVRTQSLVMGEEFLKLNDFSGEDDLHSSVELTYERARHDLDFRKPAKTCRVFRVPE